MCNCEFATSLLLGNGTSETLIDELLLGNVGKVGLGYKRQCQILGDLSRSLEIVRRQFSVNLVV